LVATRICKVLRLRSPGVARRASDDVDGARDLMHRLLVIVHFPDGTGPGIGIHFTWTKQQSCTFGTARFLPGTHYASLLQKISDCIVQKKNTWKCC